MDGSGSGLLKYWTTTWFSRLIVVGELTVGVAMIVGAFVGDFARMGSSRLVRPSEPAVSGAPGVPRARPAPRHECAATLRAGPSAVLWFGYLLASLRELVQGWDG
jgi:hypothetical protein